jgi:hypothetical protein
MSPDHWNAAAHRQFLFVLVPQDVPHTRRIGGFRFQWCSVHTFREGIGTLTAIILSD